MIEIILILAFINYLLYFLNGRKKSSLLCCGLIGYSGVSNYNIDKIKFLMLWNSIERGKDATGIYTPSSGLMKNNEPAARFFVDKEIKQLVSDNQLIAHVRAGTVGGKLAKNAHPFDLENIVLAHNGTLVDYVTLAKEYGMEYKDYDVDSQVLAKGVDRAFGEDVTEENLNIKTLTEYKGAAAILMYSKKLDCLYVFKDVNRPLCFAYDGLGGIYISSLAEPLRALGLESPFSFTDNILYCIKAGVIVSRVEYKTYADTHKEEFNGKARGRGESGQKFPKLKKEIRGLKREDASFKSYYLVNLWLLATSQGFGNNKGTYELTAVLQKGKYYRATGYYSDVAAVIQVKDENGLLRQAWIQDFDIENCIPQPGDYYKMLTNIVKTKDEKPLFAKDEIVCVYKYNMEFGTISIWHDEDNTFYELKTEHTKPLTDDEIIEYLVEQEKLQSKIVDNSTITDEIEEAKVIEEETPFIDTEPEKTAIEKFFDFEKEEVDVISNLDDVVDTKAFLGVMDILDGQINGLEEDYTANLDLTPKINEIKSTISSSKDKTYLASLVEEVPN